MIIQYVIARPFYGGLCYLVVFGEFPLITTSFVPELDLATRFDTYEEAAQIAVGIQYAIVELVEIGE